MSPLAALEPIVGELLVAGGSDVLLQGSGSFGQPEVAPGVRAASGLALTLVVGAILLAAAPNYVDAIVGEIDEQPVTCFAWGIGALVGFIGSVVLLAITVIGIILVIPLLIAFVILAIAGNVLAFLAVGDRFVDNRWVALLVAALALAVLNVVPIVGNIISFVIGSVGMGAIVIHWRR